MHETSESNTVWPQVIIWKPFLRAPQTLLISKRFRGKVNIQKPRKPHFEKQLFLDISKPFYKPPSYTIREIDLCNYNKKFAKKEIDNPFERILARECLEWFNTSKMVVFLHLNSISMEDKTPVFAALKKNDMHLRTYGKKIVSMATTGTRYEAVNHLFTSHQNIIFGQPDRANKMFKILKKTPQLVVMDVARSQLCSVLQSAGSCLVNQLNQNQQILVSHLDKHVEIQQSQNCEKDETKSES
ncbi:unnamed protein product [Leptidea sinapis]|uniref:Large ribosomal subunit protein uL10m n=1 Tax=Leptidea sinapis TaxID=189913 RepID=A0A5E4QWV2_9NEOP|nr:unnamed protein product [Leptidea sinapis]